MFRVFERRTADALWLDVAREFRDGRAEPQPSRAGPTREIARAMLGIVEPRQRWVVSREPALNPAFALAEVVWMLAGRNDSGFLNFFNGQLPRFAGTGRTYPGAYGHRLRARFRVDQLRRAYEALRSNPESRQVVLQIWDPRCDLPRRDGAARTSDVPCNLLSMLKVRRGRLELTQVVRSNDVFRGLPYNLVQFTSVQEVLAGWLGREVGTYAQLSDSLHVYEDSLATVEASNGVAAPPNTDRLDLPFTTSQRVIGRLASFVDDLVRGRIAATNVRRSVDRAKLPPAYRNIALVIGAEGARRKGMAHEPAGCISECTNALFGLLWSRWADRVCPDRIAIRATRRRRKAQHPVMPAPKAELGLRRIGVGSR